MGTLFVLHVETEVLFVGSKAECIGYAHIPMVNRKSPNWEVTDINEYGQKCYVRGYDAGHPLLFLNKYIDKIPP